ncbi:MAG: hypothetical protein WD002_08830 [Pseudomonadales bacterium]
MSESITARRNSANRPGEEVLVFRHHKIRKGYHQAFKQASERGVWLVYEKIGSRVVGDFKVIYPKDGGSNDYDENYRLARYASYEHWVETRQPGNIIGDGPLLDLSQGGGSTRRQYLLGSDGAYFMTGRMFEDVPYHLPGLDEDFELTSDPGAQPGPVRYDIPTPGDEEVIDFEYWKIRKGSFDNFDALTRDGMTPVISKMGARGIGLWRCIYPEPARGEESADYDEAVMLTRYASYQHWQAAQTPAALIGNGPDYQEWERANQARNKLVLDHSRRFLDGELYRSPPTYIPVLNENYNLV